MNRVDTAVAEDVRKERTMRRTLIACLFVCLGGFGAHAADDARGKETYVRYCGACHGPEGKGDGIAGTYMQPKPIDLTQIAKKNKGEFPIVHVMQTIDGRTTVRAHGDPQMPVWGEIFTDQANSLTSRQNEVRAKVMAITDYIRSIQEE
jgi:mono/diheme cytochrome c family protein